MEFGAWSIDLEQKSKKLDESENKIG